ncbi:hypothetical protein [Comamonas sp.]|uniref:hypothetical protein n=1 Tax=Comamonas sp. TaxID=34028 RepID=UPI00289BB3B6|nr:hypothetical protein [Comamonas sp.]
MTSHYPNPDQSKPKSDLTTAGAAALDAYLTTCRKNAIVPDVGGAWANAFRAGADYAAHAMATQASPATWDLIEQLVQLECSRERLHMEYMGKAMPADVYLRFQKLRDERIPALQAQLRGVLASSEAVCESVHTDVSCTTPDPAAPPAQPADALDAETIKKAARYEWLRDISVPPHNFYLSVPDEFGGVKYAPAEVDAAIDAAIAAMAAAQEGRKS